MRFLGVVLLCSSIVGVARAESPPPPCSSTGPRPGTPTVPANLPAFGWEVYESGWVGPDAGADVLSLERADGTGSVPVVGELSSVELNGYERRLVFRPAELLTEGAVHTLGFQGCFYSGLLTREYGVGPAIPLPDGTASLSARTEAIAHADVLHRFEWVVTLTLDSGADLTAWDDLLEMGLVAPVRAIGRPTSNTLEVRVALRCEDYPGSLDPGTHETLVSIDDLGRQSLVSASATLEASCASAIFLDEATGRVLSEAEAMALHRLPADAGTMDSAVGYVDAGTADVPASEPPRGSCSASPRHGTAPAWLLLLAAALLRRR